MRTDRNTHHDAEESAPRGAYGLRLTGVEAHAEALVPVPRDAPAFELAAELGDVSSPYEHLSPERAELRVPSGARILVDRARGRIRVRAPQPVDAEALIHPYLASAAAIVAHWQGREAFHAGTIAVDGVAWALLADRAGGKSTTVAHLASTGVPVVCDDMLVLDGLRPLPGPRSVDLRASAAERFPQARALGVTGARERWRLRIGPVDGELRLGGFVFLCWGERVALRRVSAGRRLERLLAHRGVRLAPAQPGALLAYAALPAWELCRPRSWSSMDDAAAALLSAIAG